MGGSTAQDVRQAPRREKRGRQDPVNRIARAKEIENFDKVDPNPVAYLGPVPSVAQQMAELMNNPAWVMARMREHQAEGIESPVDDIPDEYDDDDIDILTGYEVTDMEDGIPDLEAQMGFPPAEQEVVHKSTDGQAPPEGPGQAVEAVDPPPPLQPSQ